MPPLQHHVRGTKCLLLLLHLVRQPHVLVQDGPAVFRAIPDRFPSVTRNSLYLNELAMPCGAREYGPCIAQEKEEVIPKEV